MRLKTPNNVNYRHITSIFVCVSLVALCQIHCVHGIECGRVNVVYDLIRDGNQTVKGAWPFVVALYRVSDSKSLCGGTLISNKHVLTGNNEVNYYCVY